MRKKAKSIKEWIYDKDETWGTFLDMYSLDTILFNHSFAHAYFGDVWPECILCKEDGKFCNAWHIEGWKRHLQELALTPPEERLSYLAKFL